jgi:hypothetical protein
VGWPSPGCNPPGLGALSACCSAAAPANNIAGGKVVAEDAVRAKPTIWIVIAGVLSSNGEHSCRETDRHSSKRG